MNLRELYELATWADRELGGKKIGRSLGALHAALQNNAQPNQPKQGFEEQRKAVFSLLAPLDLTKLTLEQVAFLDRLGIAPYLGEQGVKAVEDILFRNQLDVATAAARVQEITQKLTQGVAKATQIKAALDGLVDPSPAAKDEALLRVTFADDASMKNVEDFKKWGIDWHDIGRGIALVHGRSPQDVRVTGATSGSIVIELSVVYEMAATVSSILLMACYVADKVLDLKKKAVEIRAMELGNEKLVQEIEHEAENQRLKGIESITNKVLAELKKEQVDGEQREALDRAVRKLLSFVQQGGEVDCVLPADVPETPAGSEAGGQATEVQQLREAFREIRQIESKVRQLGLKHPDQPS